MRFRDELEMEGKGVGGVYSDYSVTSLGKDWNGWRRLNGTEHI